MLRYLERQRLVVPGRSAGGYRLYGLADRNRLAALRVLRDRHGVGLDELAFAARLAGADGVAWIDWEQRKHERLLAA